MRQLARFDNQQKAHRLKDVLFAHGITAEVKEDREAWHTIWVHDEARLDDAKQWLEKFVSEPDAPEFAELAKKAQAQRIEAHREERARQKRAKEVHRSLERVAEGQRGRITTALIVLSVGVTLFSIETVASLRFELKHAAVEALAHRGLYDVFSGQFYRYITSTFVHLSVLHIFFNMMWLRDLGGAVEARQGSLNLGVKFLVMALLSNIFAAAFGELGLGMSGVVYGLFGYLWIRGRVDPRSGYHVPRNLVAWMMIWFVLCFTGALGPIANYAHLGGLLAGGAWGGLSGLRGRRAA